MITSGHIYAVIAALTLIACLSFVEGQREVIMPCVTAIAALLAVADRTGGTK